LDSSEVAKNNRLQISVYVNGTKKCEAMDNLGDQLMWCGYGKQHR